MAAASPTRTRGGGSFACTPLSERDTLLCEEQETLMQRAATAWLKAAELQQAQEDSPNAQISEEAARRASDAHEKAVEAERQYRERRAQFEEMWRKREEEVRARLLSLHHAEMEQLRQVAPDAPDSPSESEASACSPAPSFRRRPLGPHNPDASPAGAVTRTPKWLTKAEVRVSAEHRPASPRTPASVRAAAISMEALTQLAAQLREQMAAEAELHRARLSAMLAQELLGHKQALALQAEAHGRVAAQRETALHSRVLVATERLAGYVDSHRPEAAAATPPRAQRALSLGADARGGCASSPKEPEWLSDAAVALRSSDASAIRS